LIIMACRYVHRVGRTARAGRKGCAVTFVTERERSLLKAIVRDQFLIANLSFWFSIFFN
jgi:superfamily II DNA/RNA helicase